MGYSTPRILKVTFCLEVDSMRDTSWAMNEDLLLPEVRRGEFHCVDYIRRTLEAF